mgnify:CR=1 FL=1
MKHFYLNCLMAVFAMFFSVQLQGQTAVTIDGIKYQLAGVKAFVVGYTGKPVDIIIPETITESGLTFKVTSFDSDCFSGCSSLVKVQADYIKSMPARCFEDCSSLVSVQANQTTSISDDVFKGCTKLKRVQMRNIQYIGSEAFSDCNSLEIVEFGNIPIRFRGEDIFRNCTNLKYFIIPDGSYIHANFFYGCPRLQSIIYLSRNISVAPDSYVNIQLGSDAKVYIVPSLVKWSDHSFTYTGNIPRPSYTTKTMPADFLFTKEDFSELHADAGEFQDSVSFTFANNDMSYNVKIPFNYTIVKANLTAKVQDATRNYGDDNPKFAVKYSGFVNGEDEKVLDSPGNIVTSADRTSNVGNYDIMLQGATDNNYNITPTSGILTIDKVPLTVKPANQERIYGSEDLRFALEYEGLKNNESAPEWVTSPIISCDATTGSPAGTYNLTVSDCEARNYTVSTGRGTLTVNKAPLRITANNTSRMYYEPNPDLKCSYYGFVNGESSSFLDRQPQLTTTATLNSNAGKYPINISGAEARNYSITYESGVLQVQKRSLNVSAENYTRAYNEENPKFALNYKGFVNGEDENVLIAKPTIATIATKSSDVGTYNLTISGGIADNYDFTYNNGTLKIEKAYQTIDWNQNLENIPLYSQVELNAQASSDMEITYELNNDTVCNLTHIGLKTYIDCFHDGKVVITAYQPGNKNYWPTTKSYKVVTVTNPTGIETIYKEKSLTKRIIAANGYISVPSLDSNETLSVYTLTGLLLYSGHEQTVTTGSGVFIVRIGDKTAKIAVK